MRIAAPLGAPTRPGVYTTSVRRFARMILVHAAFPIDPVEREAALPDLLDGEPEVLRFEIESVTELDL